jgi:hypothetical protein
MPEQQPNEKREGSPLNPDGNALSGRDEDATAGAGDGSLWENVPSGEKAAAARQPQNAPAQPERPERAAGG